MAIVKKVYSASDAQPQVMYAHRDSDSQLTYPVLADSNGKLIISDGISIPSGSIPGTSIVHKFGNAEDFDTGDGFVTVWGGAEDGMAWEQMTISYSTTAIINCISSNVGSDNQPIEIQGLDANYDLTVQTATLNGQSVVTFSTALIRVFRMKNQGVTDNAGHVFCFETGLVSGGIPTASTIRAVMSPLQNQTLMAVYTIPNGKTGYLQSFFAGTSGANRSAAYEIELRQRPFGGVFQIKHKSALSDDGTSHWNHIYQVYEKISAKTDVEMRAQIATATITAASISAGFDIILVDD